MIDSLVDSFWGFVAERHRVWWRRYIAQRPAPWSSDLVLQQLHVTNVYRELDPGTVFALDRLQRAPSVRDAVAFTVAYRFVNRRQTVELFGPTGPYVADRHAWAAYIDAMHAAGTTVRTARHLTPSRRYGSLALDRVASDPRLGQLRGSATTWNTLQALPGVGSFVGWQLYVDLAQAGWIEDLDPRFVRVGDGAAFALSVLEGSKRFGQYHHNGSTTRVDGGRVRPGLREQVRLGHLLLHLHDTQVTALPAGFWTTPPCHLLAVWDLEHALCEWLRWELVRQGHRSVTKQNRYLGAST